MKARLTFLTRYILFWLFAFTIFRLAFMLYQFNLTVQVTCSDFFTILVRGIWMDASLTGYIILLSSVSLAFLIAAGKKTLTRYFGTLTAILLSVFSLIFISDFELYKNWGFRIDATPLLYLKTPREAMASVEIYMIVIFIVAAVLAVLGFFWIYKKWVEKTLNNVEPAKWKFAIVMLFIAGLMVLPIRGGLGVAPMNPGKVYFSQNVYSNHAALNAAWNMMYSVSKSGKMSKRYPDYIEESKAQQLFSEMMKCQGDPTKVLRSDRPNIVLILMESFSSVLIEPLGGKSGVTPRFNELTDEGILFTKVDASGDRSDKGIIAVLSGFPAQPTMAVIKYPTKSRKLPAISKKLADAGYRTTFYYGGDPDFANIRSFLYSAKFQRIVTQDNFPRNLRNAKWGVHDEYVFNYLLNDIDTAKGPFFKMFFTLSSHEPFDIPSTPKFPSNERVDKFLSSAYYTDSCIGNFFDEAKKRDWYKNTLFILIADHGHRYLGDGHNYSAEKFAIPMLWLGGELNCEPFKVNKNCSQIDLPATLLNQLNLSDSSFVFSRDVLSPEAQPFAYYAFNNGYGFITQTDTVIFDHVSGKYIKKSGVNVEESGEKVWAFFRVYQNIFLGL